jgi:hypothetical protein
MILQAWNADFIPTPRILTLMKRLRLQPVKGTEMITRVYEFEELSESAELLASNPPSWIQFLLFAVILGLLAAGNWAGKDLGNLLKEHNNSTGI